ncbi:MAG: hypothetical protein ACYTBP_14895 [Planctomycetota bacterium]|jgi:hypothetical protein
MFGHSAIDFVDIGAGGTINSTKFALTEQLEFPVITSPSVFNMGTGLDATGTTLTVSPADSGKYNNITLRQKQGQAGKLEISGGSVVLHITGNIGLH